MTFAIGTLAGFAFLAAVVMFDLSRPPSAPAQAGRHGGHGDRMSACKSPEEMADVLNYALDGADFEVDQQGTKLRAYDDDGNGFEITVKAIAKKAAAK